MHGGWVPVIGACRMPVDCWLGACNTLALQQPALGLGSPLCLALTGEQLLGAGEVFAIRPLQLYAITEQLQQGKPTCASGDAKTDLGHILDFTCRLKYLKVRARRLSCGASLSWLPVLTAGLCEGDQGLGCPVHERGSVFLTLCFCL